MRIAVQSDRHSFLFYLVITWLIHSQVIFKETVKWRELHVHHRTQNVKVTSGESHTYLFMALCDVSGFLAQVRPAQGVASVKEEMLQSNDPINKASEEKNPTSANTVPRSLVWNINWTRTSEFTPVSSTDLVSSTRRKYVISVVTHIIHGLFQITVNKCKGSMFLWKGSSRAVREDVCLCTPTGTARKLCCGENDNLCVQYAVTTCGDINTDIKLRSSCVLWKADGIKQESSTKRTECELKSAWRQLASSQPAND